jgi:hypothetical protein
MNPYGASRLPFRARRKIKRELLRAPIVRPWSESRYHARLGRHAENLPWLTSDRFDVFAELRDHGIAIRDATTTIPAAVLEVADRFVARLRETTQKPLEITLPPDVAVDPALYEWGLAEENLDLAEHYIGLPVRYLGAAVRREQVGVHYRTRRWHKDIDDRRMLKIIVYLNDVRDGGGPFEYLNRNASDHAARIFRYSAGLLSDAAMARVVPPADWVQVTGPRLTAIFVDPRRFFHRAQPPTNADRYTMTFTYMSKTPLFETFSGSMLGPAALAGLSHELTPRQRRAAMAE